MWPKAALAAMSRALPPSMGGGCGSAGGSPKSAGPSGTRCGDPLASALGVAAALVERSRRFCEAVAARSAMLTGVERFYLDILECQWRLDALDAMLAAVSAAVGEAPFLEEYRGISSSDMDAGEIDQNVEVWRLLEEDWRRDALERCLLEIDAQQHAAIEALQERAETYATGVLASNGLIDRLATGDCERERAGLRLTHTALNIFSEITCEARQLSVAMTLPEGLQVCLPTLRRRRDFWQRQLEETWSAWESATEGMLSLGRDAVAAWVELSDAVRAGRLYCGAGEHPQRRIPRALILNALAEAAAQSLEVELLNSLGLEGLDGEAVRAIASAAGLEDQRSFACDADHDNCDLQSDTWSAMRRSLLRSVLQQLEKEGALCDIELRFAPGCFHAQSQSSKTPIADVESNDVNMAPGFNKCVKSAPS